MPFTGSITFKHNRKTHIHVARLVSNKPNLYAVWGLMSDSPKPYLGVEIEFLKNYNTPPKKLIAVNGGKRPAKGWISYGLISVDKAKNYGFELDLSEVKPRPKGKGWAKNLEEVYPR